MKNFNFKRRNLIDGPHLLGVLITLAGVFALVSPSFLASGSSVERILYVGIGAIVIGLFIITSYQGIQIDAYEMRYKNYVSIGGFKLGEWESLQDISKIKVISKSYLSTNTPNGVSPTLSGKVTDFKTLLYSDASKPVLILDYSNKNKAVKEAKQLATNLQAELDLNLSD